MTPKHKVKKQLGSETKRLVADKFKKKKFLTDSITRNAAGSNLHSPATLFLIQALGCSSSSNQPR